MISLLFQRVAVFGTAGLHKDRGAVRILFILRQFLGVANDMEILPVMREFRDPSLPRIRTLPGDCHPVISGSGCSECAASHEPVAARFATDLISNSSKCRVRDTTGADAGRRGLQPVSAAQNFWIRVHASVSASSEVA